MVTVHVEYELACLMAPGGPLQLEPESPNAIVRIFPRSRIKRSVCLQDPTLISKQFGNEPEAGLGAKMTVEPGLITSIDLELGQDPTVGCEQEPRVSGGIEGSRRNERARCRITPRSTAGGF